MVPICQECGKSPLRLILLPSVFTGKYGDVGLCLDVYKYRNLNRFRQEYTNCKKETPGVFRRDDLYWSLVARCTDVKYGVLDDSNADDVGRVNHQRIKELINTSADAWKAYNDGNKNLKRLYQTTCTHWHDCFKWICDDYNF